jgi:dolichol-phosphate mannosyltransferase
MYNEALNASALAERFEKLIGLHSSFDLELIAIDDGSTDGSSAALANEFNSDSRVTIVELARNFGSHQAVTAGLDLAAGDCAIVLGADLQEPVELVGLFLDEWQKGSDVVWGIRRKRAHKGLGTLFSRGFSRLFHKYSEIKTYPVEGPSGVLVSRVVLDSLAELRERNRNIYGLIAWLGFPSSQVNYEQHPRNAGVTKWTRGRLARLAMDSFVEFSSVPLKAATLAGAIIATSGFLYAIVLVVRAIFVGTAPEGWTTVSVLVLVLGGFQLLMLGVVGEYLWRTTDEARKRPGYVTRNIRKLGQQ